MSELHDDGVQKDFKQKFYEKYHEYMKQQKGVKGPWTDAKIKEVINIINSFNSGISRVSMGYYWTSKYEIMSTADGEALVFKRKNPDAPPVVIIPCEQFFDVIWKVHEAVGHGGRDKMVGYIKPKMYIPRNAIELFIALCPKCSAKYNKSRCKHSKEKTTSKGQFAIHDFQSSSCNEYKWLLHYQDELSKYTSLRPLKTNQPTEVALELMKIFLTYGPPDILQSSIEIDVTLRVIGEINAMWPQCNIAYGNLESQMNHEDVKNMMLTWVSENKTKDWTVGCFFVQYLLNTSLNDIIKTTPYNAIFGRDAKTIGTENSSEEPLVEGTVASDVTMEFEEIHISDDEPYEDVGEDVQTGIVNFESLQKNFTCIVCQNEASAGTGAHKCMSCKSVHVICGLTDGEELTKSKIVCFICNRNIEPSKNLASKGVKRSTEKGVENKFKKRSSCDRSSQIELDPLKSLPVTFEPGYFEHKARCNCKLSDTLCQNNRCACYKSSTPCSSICHIQISCSNVK